MVDLSLSSEFNGLFKTYFPPLKPIMVYICVYTVRISISVLDPILYHFRETPYHISAQYPIPSPNPARSYAVETQTHPKAFLFYNT